MINDVLGFKKIDNDQAEAIGNADDVIELSPKKRLKLIKELNKASYFDELSDETRLFLEKFVY